ncbi:hypothetical protein [Paracoccus luteus]|uniref:hypothetical protein n=1 Tax=Paracoccus luteus TaxID=2508543 RepID=UPI00106F78FC|nr:hypothetical protein [Paracoccus luteus]
MTTDATEADDRKPWPGMLAGNLGEPIRLKDVQLVGVSATASQPGGQVSVYTKMALTSDDAMFYKIIGGMSGAIQGFARASGAGVSIERASTVLLVIKPDASAELWVDKAAMVVHQRLKRPGAMPGGTIFFESDVADVLAVEFPLVEIAPHDRILLILREGWRFALYFDLDRSNGDLDVSAAQRTIGALLRQMKYADLYTAVANNPLFDKIVSAGWFPFLELMSGEFQMLTGMLDADLSLEQAEATLLSKFNDARIERMFERWMQRAHFREKEVIMRSAVNAFKARDPVSVIKNTLTEIEGIMAVAYHRGTGKHTRRIPDMLEFVVESASNREGEKDTLLFPSAFARYLRDYTYASFDRGEPIETLSRHAVGHGLARSDQYTMTRALQSLLTIDQLAFYG